MVVQESAFLDSHHKADGRLPASCDHEIYTAAVLNLSFILGLVACRYFPSIIEGEAS
jgi:hypothetical protein